MGANWPSVRVLKKIINNNDRLIFPTQPSIQMESTKFVTISEPQFMTIAIAGVDTCVF